LPDDALPAYTFVPGKNPHPISDPAGHSYGHRPVPLVSFEAERWRECRVYLRGIDLFNHGYYWEAHEAWETVWNAASRRGPTADFLKALIQLAVAGVKALQQMPEGMRTHAARAAELLRDNPGTSDLGLWIRDLIALANEVCERGWPSATPILRLDASLPDGSNRKLS
jgi:hypothetical protein